jgi:hypothetical protein
LFFLLDLVGYSLALLLFQSNADESQCPSSCETLKMGMGDSPDLQKPAGWSTVFQKKFQQFKYNLN